MHLHAMRLTHSEGLEITIVFPLSTAVLNLHILGGETPGVVHLEAVGNGTAGRSTGRCGLRYLHNLRNSLEGGHPDTILLGQGGTEETTADEMSTAKALGAELGCGQTNEGIGHETGAKDVTTVYIPAGGDVDTDDLGTLITLLGGNEIRKDGIIRRRHAPLRREGEAKHGINDDGIVSIHGLLAGELVEEVNTDVTGLLGQLGRMGLLRRGIGGGVNDGHIEAKQGQMTSRDETIAAVVTGTGDEEDLLPADDDGRRNVENSVDGLGYGGASHLHELLAGEASGRHELSVEGGGIVRSKISSGRRDASRDGVESIGGVLLFPVVD